MARYGRDYGRDRWSGGGGYGQGGFGGGGSYGTGGSSRGGEFGGMGSDASYGGGSQYNAGHSGFGPGGGAYDNDFNAGGYGGYGYGPTSGGGRNRGGYGGSQDYDGYGAETGFSGGYGGGGQSDFGRGSQQRGGFGYGGGGYTSGGSPGYGGAGYTSGGQGYGYGGYGGGRDVGGGLSYGGSQLSGQQDEVRRLRAADVMTDNPECVTPETTLADAARKMRDLDVGIIPVVESDSSKRLKGVLTDRDIAIRAVADGKDANTTRVMEVMTTQVETCNKNDSLRDVLSVMEREQVRRVPITDREGRLVGIIAQADVATEIATPQGQRTFADTVESISEPGNPRGGRWGGRASQGRGGIMGAVRSAVSNLGGDASRAGGSTAPGSFRGRPDGGSQGTTGNNDPRAMNDPGSENI